LHTQRCRSRSQLITHGAQRLQPSEAAGALEVVLLELVAGRLVQAIERWGFGTTQKQTWTTNLGALDRANVQLSTTGSTGTFTTMSGGSSIGASQKQANVLVPSAATSTARVRVTWSNPPAGFAATGINPGNFRIEAPLVNVTAPTAGEVWVIGSAKTI
jgi:hypothetical protein